MDSEMKAPALDMCVLRVDSAQLTSSQGCVIAVLLRPSSC